MDDFKESFRAEGQELINNLEDALLKLEDDFSDMDQIGAVFRVMHSLKGGAGMFGFGPIEEITHDLETIYDKIRNNQFELSKAVFDVTYKVLDHLREIIVDSELEQEQNIENHKSLIEEIGKILPKDGAVAAGAAKEEKKKGGLLVRLKIDKALIANGTNPFYLIEDLSEIGSINVKAFVGKDAFDKAEGIKETHLFWFVHFPEGASDDELDDVFMFVEDKVHIEKEAFAGKWEDLQWDLDIDYATAAFADFIKKVEAVKEKKPAVKKSDASSKSNTPSAKPVETMRVSKEKLDDLMSIVSELVTTQAALKMYQEKTKDSGLENLSEAIEKLSRRLRDNAFGLTLTPLTTITSRFKRLVRDVSNEVDKDIHFNIVGDETELDKTLVEKIVDPVMHMLRNSVDHGIETKEDRAQTDKDPQGTITLKAYYTGTNVNIEISDDGKGINPDIMFEKAVEKGIVGEHDILTDQEKLQLIFRPGFSTAEQVTDLSGRGVGMDVVRKNIEELRGEVLLTSEVGKGSKITLKLPLTLSIIDGLLIRLDDLTCILPISAIHKCYKVPRADVENEFNHLITLEGEEIPYVDLRKNFGVGAEDQEIVELIVVENGDRLVALIFEKIVGELQAVIKPLGDYYSHQDYFSGLPFWEMEVLPWF